jgi:hypothetical protein
MSARRFLKNHAKQHKSGQGGVALVTMLLLLSLLTALSLSMVMVFSSDMLMNGYDRNFRASFYAADAGSSIVRQDIENRLNNLLPGSLTVGTYPLPSSAAATVVSGITSAYSNPVAINSTSSFPESFYVSNASLTLISCTVGYFTDATLSTKGSPPANTTSATLNTAITCPSPYPYAYSYIYTYFYSVTIVGTAIGSGTTAVTDTGNIIINASSMDTVTSFSQYGTFLDQMTICSAELIGGTITGRQFTNGAWTFGSDQSYNFTGQVESAGANAGYMFSDGTCNQVAGPSDTYKSATVSPNFQAGLLLGQPPVVLPTDDFNQRSAVITGVGVNNNGTEPANPTTAQLSAALQDSNSNNSYSASTTSGVFVPANSSNAINGGGIWVEGNASVTVAASGTTAQVYTITQGSTVTTVTVTPGATPGTGTTVLSSAVTSHGTTTTTTASYSGVPTQTDPNTGIVTNACVLYVDGNITSVSGTIQNNTGVNITALDNITITNNLTYLTPVVNSSGTATTAAATETQALGIYTASGSVYLQAPSNNANMEVDASIMVTKSNGGTCNMGNSCTGVLGVTGSNNIGTLTIVGGRIQSQSMLMPAGTINTRNVFADPRFNGTLAPPFFPKPTTIIKPPSYTSTLQRTGWVLQTAY